MSQIELAPKTRDILELTIPKWTKILSEVNFDGGKLEESQQKNMGNSSMCYIGELHERNTLYDDCYICWGLSRLASHVFKIDVDETYYKKVIEKRICFDGIDLGALKNPNVTADKFLKYIADHVQNEHGDIIKECGVSK